MVQKDRVLTLDNIEDVIREFCAKITPLGASIQGKTGIDLLIALKREMVNAGPYPNVTLFEAANRIMSDMVILYGVAGLLKAGAYPFSEYLVEFGNEDRNGFDIRGLIDGCLPSGETPTLAGEAFNVAPSFLQGKKSSALKKLQANAGDYSYRFILFNSDALPTGNASQRITEVRKLSQHNRSEDGIHQFCVDIQSQKLYSVEPRAVRKLKHVVPTARNS